MRRKILIPLFILPAALGLTLPAGAQNNKAELLWTHPLGDCTHLVKQHPNGHPVPNAPCAHPRTPEHPDGHNETLPCPHLVTEHSGGHDTGQKSPCTHLKFGRPEHPGGHAVIAPCPHRVKEHPGGHSNKVPCGHLIKPHKAGHPLPPAPCLHTRAEHPDGHEGAPCVHPLKPVRVDPKTGVQFFTSDPLIQSEVLRGIQSISALGVIFKWPRPLSVFHRPPVNGDAYDNKDPFWSHYNNRKHAIQITKGHSREDMIEGIRHELGHALLGHACATIPSPGGPHAMTDAADPALALSEGWAHFVGVVLTASPTASSASFRGLDWEQAQSNKDIVFSPRNEFRVGAILWDLFDQGRDADGRDRLKLKFTEVFAVFSPSLQTLLDDNRIPNVEDYLARLGRRHPERRSEIMAAYTSNLTSSR